MKNLIFSSLIITLNIFLYGCDPCKKNPADCPGGCTSCPEVISVTPSIAYAGETVTIAGMNFGKDATKVEVSFADRLAIINSISATGEIIATIPEPSSANDSKQVDVTVKAPAPNSSQILTSSINGKFTYKSPTIQSFLPITGAFGTTVTITGDFGNKAISSVLFNNIATSFSKINVSTISAIVPKGAGTGRIAIQFASGLKLETVQSFDYQFTYTVSTFVTTAALNAFAQTRTGAINAIQDIAFYNNKFYVPSLFGGLFIIEQNGVISDFLLPKNNAGSNRPYSGITKGSDGQLYFGGIGTLDYITTRGSLIQTDITGYEIKDLAFFEGKVYATRWLYNSSGTGAKELIVFDPNTRSITPISGTSEPKAIASGSTGLYFSDLHAIYKYNPISLYAGNKTTPGSLDGTGGLARFNRPASMVMDSKGKIYVADTESHQIKMIDNGNVKTIAGSAVKGALNGIGKAAQFDTPFGMEIVNDNTLYIVGNDYQIRKIAIE